MNLVLIAAFISLFGGWSRAWAQQSGNNLAVPSPPGAVPGDSPAPMTDIHDIKPALPMGGDLPMWTWVAGVLMIALVILCVIWWLRRRKGGSDEIMQQPEAAPDVEALGRLDVLAADTTVDGKLFYFRLSAIVRHYLERRFGIPAVEMTTEELLPAVDRLGLPPDISQPFRSFCRAADPIKFAGAAVNRQRMAEDLALARNLVMCTTAPAEEPEVESVRKGPGTVAPGRAALPASASETTETSSPDR